MRKKFMIQKHHEELRTVDSGSRTHISICLTHTFEFIPTVFFDLMVGLTSKYSFSIMRSNMLPIERNRTNLVEISLSNPRTTHCLFLDTDIVPQDKNFLDIMVSYDLPIVGLLCTKKLPPFEPIIYRKDAPPEECLNGFWTAYTPGLNEVDATGTGCLLVKREVFESLRKPYFRFISAYEQGLYQSEDIYFLESARKQGFSAYVDTTHTCLHYGSVGRGIDDFNRSCNR
jgi:hypothetical protein